MPHPLTEHDFAKTTNASPEMMDKLRRYHALLKQWNPKINLVSAPTLNDAWRRHFLDSAQLRPEVLGPTQEGSCLQPNTYDLGPSIADLGSGAGFPGMVLAMMGVPNISLIERDVRKCAFLRTVAAETKTKVTILNKDISTLTEPFDLIISRALAEVGELLNLSAHIRKPSTSCLFLKGKNLDAELTKAQKDWTMQVRKIPSISDSEAEILYVTQVVSKE